MVETDRLFLSDINIYQELTRFSLNKTGSYEAERGNDDLAMCLVLFAWLSTQPYFKDLTNSDVVKDIFRIGTKDIEDDMVPFGLIDTGHSDITERSGKDIWTAF